MAKSIEIERAARAGKEAIRLFERDAADIGDRLPSGLVEQLRGDVAVVEGAPPSTRRKRQEKRVSTRDERTTAATAAKFVARVRDAVSGSGASAATQKAWGVGVSVKANSTTSVLAALDNVIARGANDGALAAVGLKPSDIARARALRDALRGADQAQRGKADESKATTKERDAAIKRAFSAAYQVGSAGALEYDETPKEAEYEALKELSTLPGKRKKAAPAKPASPPIS